MKQYLSIIEREVNNIIQLSKLPNTENKHYNWYDMKNFVKKRGIELEYVPFRLYKALDALINFVMNPCMVKQISQMKIMKFCYPIKTKTYLWDSL